MELIKKSNSSENPDNLEINEEKYNCPSCNSQYNLQQELCTFCGYTLANDEYTSKTNELEKLLAKKETEINAFKEKNKGLENKLKKDAEKYQTEINDYSNELRKFIDLNKQFLQDNKELSIRIGSLEEIINNFKTNNETVSLDHPDDLVDFKFYKIPRKEYESLNHLAISVKKTIQDYDIGINYDYEEGFSMEVEVEDNHVTKIRIMNLILNIMPNSLKNLQNINHLDLSSNRIYNLIPEIESLTKLEKLNINNNNIREINLNMPNLKFLNFLNNKLESMPNLNNNALGYDGKNEIIMEDYYHLHQLIRGKRGKNFIYKIENKRVTYIELKQIEYDYYTTTKEDYLLISKFEKLKTLKLDDSKLDDESILIFSKLNELENVSFRLTRIKSLPKYFLNLKNIKFINVDKCGYRESYDSYRFSKENLFELKNKGVEIIHR